MLMYPCQLPYPYSSTEVVKLFFIARLFYWAL